MPLREPLANFLKCFQMFYNQRKCVGKTTRDVIIYIYGNLILKCCAAKGNLANIFFQMGIFMDINYNITYLKFVSLILAATSEPAANMDTSDDDDVRQPAKKTRSSLKCGIVQSSNAGKVTACTAKHLCSLQKRQNYNMSNDTKTKTRTLDQVFSNRGT